MGWDEVRLDSGVSLYASEPDTCTNSAYSEVCDNQRWGIDKVLNGQTVYHAGVRGGDRTQTDWPKWRAEGYCSAAQVVDQNNVARCQA